MLGPLALFGALEASPERNILLVIDGMSHFGIWERQRIPLLEAILDWLSTGTVLGVAEGRVDLDVDGVF